LRTAAVWMLVLGLAPGLEAAAAPPSPPASPPAGATDARVVHILQFDCRNELGRREITLFGNGTIRLREGELGREWVGLAELGPDEMQAYLNRLGEEDLSKMDRLPRGVEGRWVEKCDFNLHLAGQPARSFQFGRYDTLPLALSRVLRVAEDMAAEVEDLKGDEQLPVDYEPQRGDILKRFDGELFKVYGFTTDKRGLEMQGVKQPIILYVLREELRKEFVAVVERPRKWKPQSR
jgi:hypothetical protein